MTTDYQAIKDKMTEILRNASVTAEVGVARFGIDDPFSSKDSVRKAWPHFSYVVFFKGPRGGFSTDYHCGADDVEQGHYYPKPHKRRVPIGAEVLGMLCRDALDAREESFEAWASTFGYGPDSRAAEAIYNKCCAIWHDVRKCLTEAQILELADLSGQL